MPELEIQPYADVQYEEVVDVLAEAYLTNPLHIAMFGGTGPDQLRQNRTLFALTLRDLFPGRKLVAIQGGVVGFVHWVNYPGCRPLAEKIESIMLKLIAEFVPGVALRLIAWLHAWRDRDPDAPHIHLGPIAVKPSCQRTGIGRLLMGQYCAYLDRTGEAGYLETDRPENLSFYAKSGFEVTSEIELFGVPNWFMKRQTV